MEIKPEDDAIIVALVPRFDAYTASDIERVLKDLISKGTKKIVCDFSGTEYVASAGLRVLLSSAKNLKSLGGQILLASMKPYVYEVFEIAGFTQIFKIFNSKEEAIRSLSQV